MMAYPWLAVFKDARGESCLGAVVAITEEPRAVWIATADHCINAISSVRVGRSTFKVQATGCVYARKVGTDFMLAIVEVPPDKALPALAPLAIGAGAPDQAIVRRRGTVTPIGVRRSTADEVRTFNAECPGPNCGRCDLRMTVVDPARWRIQDHDSGGPVLSGGRLAGVISTESLDGTGVSSYCPAELPHCALADDECWRRAGFDLDLALYARFR